MSETRIRNLTGAFALIVADRVRVSADAAASVGGAGPAALTSLLVHGPLTIDQLRRIVGLSHSAAVRLVDRLQHGGLATRSGAAVDRRQAVVTLTRRGRAKASQVLQLREREIAAVLAPLTPDEAEQLATLLERMLDRPRERAEANLLCRLCDYDGCESAGDRCPVDRGVTAVSD